ncbi:MAG: hypothetical protein ACI84R_001465 [Candidatus Azotimanducaceae bacterium]
MAEKKKPAETTDVVEIKEPLTEGETSGDEVAMDVETVDIIRSNESVDEITDPVGEAVMDDADVPITSVPNESEKSGIFPLIFGGVLAVIIGFIIARSDVIDNFLPPSWRINAGEVVLQDQITSSQAEIDALNKKLAAVSSELANAPAPILLVDEALTAQVVALAERLDAIEERSVTTGNSGADFSDDFATLLDGAEKQQAVIDALLADARVEVQTSQDAASYTLARAAVTRILAAIETGAPFTTALDDLEAAGMSEIPEALRAVSADGVVTLAKLQDAIPEVSRAALTASPADADAGLGGFLKRQLGARSVAPREGNDPDAILSRVEGAVRKGQLADALSEAEALPQEAKSAMSDWLNSAASRLAVTSASEVLMQRLAAN